ncbi:flavin reductase family protein [Paracoccus saliphilus]|uniref:Flavin reductase family protein n=1 Tax=Paracoccus saliphilus TaxID=405559 RepID=A0AA46A5I5_9RHOB|nr:flavin reductase family protein [Paracoccus saliphilus]WCR04192.1 flavin reductase family protein [Paracoccus saliphilus]SIS81280.1 NADH-FMN oxidoreductase RutF, flavin reductase (DIM6/NTAB) family [Paracoccus saliphilus]
MTQLDLTALAPQERYKLLTALVIPRPVAWVTTQDKSGRVNAAPFSFFNLFGQDPALVILGLEHARDGSGPKDTARNIAATEEFVVNIVTPDLIGPMVETAAAYPPDVSEPQALGLELAPSSQVAPPRLAAAPVAIECRLKDTLRYSDERDIVVGEAVALAARDGLIDTDRMHVDWEGGFPLARLFADRYARLEEIARHPIPQPKEQP